MISDWDVKEQVVSAESQHLRTCYRPDRTRILEKIRTTRTTVPNVLISLLNRVNKSLEYHEIRTGCVWFVRNHWWQKKRLAAAFTGLESEKSGVNHARIW